MLSKKNAIRVAVVSSCAALFPNAVGARTMSVTTGFGLPNIALVTAPNGFDDNVQQGTAGVSKFNPAWGTFNNSTVAAQWNNHFPWEVGGSAEQQPPGDSSPTTNVEFFALSGWSTPTGNQVLNAYTWGDGWQGPFAGTVQNSGTSAPAWDTGFTGTGLATFRMWSSLTAQGAALRPLVTGTTGSISGMFSGLVTVVYDYTPTPIVTSGGGGGGGSGNWSTAGNWVSGQAPNGNGAVAAFFDGDSIATFNLDQNVTLGSALFDTTSSRAINGTSTLTLNDSSDDPQVVVAAGSHSVGAPIHFARSAAITVEPSGSTLTLSGALTAASGVTLTKLGQGNLVVNNVRSQGLNVAAGKVTIAPSSTAAGTSKVTSLTVVPGAKLDLKDNKLITASALGTWNGSAYTGVSGLVDSGRGNASNAQWNGSTGIITTDTRAVNNNDLVSIGTAKVGDFKGIADTATTTFAGQTVLGSDTVAMVTWGGDATLDGKINIDDYGQIDSTWDGDRFTGSGWYEGDFNYDGKIDINDYGIIDFNYAAQGSAFPTAGGVGGTEGVTGVPEPAGLAAVAGLVGAATLRRRRRLGD